jgi:site-specific DNA recombinase
MSALIFLQLFDPENLGATVVAMVEAGGNDDASEVDRRKLSDCDERLEEYRAALDSGADPVVVAGWIAELQGEQLVAEAELATLDAETPSEADVRRMLQELGDMTQVLADADPEDEAEVYASLGLSITYHRSDAWSWPRLRPVGF